MFAVSRPAVLLLIAAPLLACLPCAFAEPTPSRAIPAQPSDIFSQLRKRDGNAYTNPNTNGGMMLTVSIPYVKELTVVGQQYLSRGAGRTTQHYSIRRVGCRCLEQLGR